ncbi:olfactory receptor 2F1-like [Leuresthes tenuis]|uniref:olfactory receptor 2F1-like n=1 Tax=Leuresthes tenuis TaxID=355514 RepID=UPI003B50762D
MDNETSVGDILIVEGFKVTPQSSVPVFVLLLLAYIFIMVSNIGLVVVIFSSSRFHQPMYLLFCNMCLNDVFGATIKILQILRDLFRSGSERYIHYINCVVQAFCVNLYGSTSHTVLIIMAFDRYVAICDPLRYSTTMTHRMVVKLSLAAWGSTFVAVTILLSLTIRLTRCRRVIMNLYCDNASLFKLSCESVLINQIYGLGYTVVLLGSSFCSIALTYLKIAAVCLRSKNKALNSKALQTCATHLTVYLLLLGSAFIITALHRFPQLTEYRNVVSVVGEVTLPALSATIYGLQIKEIRQRVVALFQRKGKLCRVGPGQ